MSPLSLALLNLRARLARTLSLSLVVGLALATALTLLALAQAIERGVGVSADERGADLTVAQRNAPDILSGYVAEDLGPRIRAQPGVKAISGELVMFAPIDEGKQSVVFGWSEDSYFWSAMPIAEGRKPAPFETRVAVVGQGAAAALGKNTGDQVEIFGEPFRIVGLSGYAAAINRGVIVLKLSDLQELSFRKGQVTAFQIAIDHGRTDVDRLKADIEALGRLVVLPTDDLLRGDRNFAFMRAISSATSIIALAMGGISLFSALMMAVQERRRELGVLSALGWSSTRIRSSIVCEGALIGAIGGALAAPLTMLAGLMFGALPGIGSFLQIEATPDFLIGGFLASIALCVVGSLYPAIRATRLSPAHALRSI